MTTEELIKQTQKLQGDLWKWFKARATTERQSDEWWEEQNKFVEDIATAYKGTPFEYLATDTAVAYRGMFQFLQYQDRFYTEWQKEQVK